MPVGKKRLVGVAASRLLFATFGLFDGQLVVGLNYVAVFAYEDATSDEAEPTG